MRRKFHSIAKIVLKEKPSTMHVTKIIIVSKIIPGPGWWLLPNFKINLNFHKTSLPAENLVGKYSKPDKFPIFRLPNSQYQ